MARGHQKEQSKQKNAKKNEQLAKQKGHSAADQKKAAAAALTYSCTVCRSQMGDPKTYKQHFESKHPKAPLPELLKGVAA
ncbi:znf706 [Bugula neritina]|uniref:Znf706 n=1 Tax=Bugula neritina TaxID=10212 RepID=A0A7J7JJE9_BUGNE|nr:znf706 [Bugula neritina]